MCAEEDVLDCGALCLLDAWEELDGKAGPCEGVREEEVVVVGNVLAPDLV